SGGRDDRRVLYNGSPSRNADECRAARHSLAASCRRRRPPADFQEEPDPGQRAAPPARGRRSLLSRIGGDRYVRSSVGRRLMFARWLFFGFDWERFQQIAPALSVAAET